MTMRIMPDIAGIRPQCNGLDHIGRGTDAASGNQRNLIADPLIPKSLIHGCQSQLNGNTYIVPDTGGSCAETG